MTEALWRNHLTEKEVADLVVLQQQINAYKDLTRQDQAQKRKIMKRAGERARSKGNV